MDLHAELVDDILRPAHEGGPLLDETVTALRGGPVDRTGHGEDGAPLLEGLVCGDEGSAPRGGLDDEKSLRQARNDAVAQGERLLVGNVEDRELGEHR